MLIDNLYNILMICDKFWIDYRYVSALGGTESLDGGSVWQVNRRKASALQNSKLFILVFF